MAGEHHQKEGDKVVIMAGEHHHKEGGKVDQKKEVKHHKPLEEVGATPASAHVITYLSSFNQSYFSSSSLFLFSNIFM